MMKYLFCIMSLLLTLGLSAPASADWVDDSAGTEHCYNPTKDLCQAKVEVFGDTNPANTGDQEPWMLICIDMCVGSTLPGVVQLELDVDQNSATGTGMMISAPVTPCYCKDCQGIDIIIQTAIREQGPGNHIVPPAPHEDATMAWCPKCEGLSSAQCAKRGQNSTTGCNEGTGGICYDMGGMCASATNPICHLLEDNCTGCNDPGDFWALDKPCEGGPCTLPRRRGEWRALINEIEGVTYIGGIDVDWGRDFKYPPEVDDPDERRYCQIIPYGEILDEAKEKGASFNLVTALEGLPTFTIETWYDTVTGFSDQDDITSYPDANGFFDITDWLPNDDCVMQEAQANGGCCFGDFEPDGDVDGTDAFKFKASFGRRNCLAQCP